MRRAGVQSGDGDKYKDDDRSASRFAKKKRENFQRVCDAVEAERYKIVWFWSTSRQTRGDVPLDELAAASVKAGVLWCINGQLLNPANDDDMLIAGINNLIDKQYSARISKDSHGAAASRSRWPRKAPHGPVIYEGTHRKYDPDVMVKGRHKFIRDVPGDVYDGNELEPSWRKNSHAYRVVCEIFGPGSRGVIRCSSIRRDLEDRVDADAAPRKNTDTPTPLEPGPRVRWDRDRSPSYIGKRAWHAESGKDARAGSRRSWDAA